jgi:hypothetical protein
LLDSSRLRREISRLYDKNPQGWSISVGKDRAGFFDVLISNGAKAWQVKEYQVNPYKFVGLGSRIPNITPNRLSAIDYSFGLRPIGVEEIKELTTLLDNPQGMNELTSRLLSQKPVTSEEATESPAILQGPVMQSHRPLEALSTAHSRLDERMRKELQRLVNREFRHTVTPYI